MPEYLLILMRSLFSFVFLLIICRILGKQQVSQLTFFDYVVGITIGSIAATLSVDQNVKILNGVISLGIWGGVSLLIALLALKSRIFEILVGGKPTVIIENGKIQEKNLQKAKLSVEQLMLNLREKNAFKLADVELAVFETNGQVSVMKKSDNEPITPKLLGMAVEQEKRPYIFIRDGVVQEQSLESAGYSKEWLYGEIQKQGASNFKDVYVAQMDSKGNLYVDLKNDKKLEPASNARQVVAAQIKKVKADLDMYALDTENQEATQLFMQQAEKVQSLNEALAPYLK
ncbi:hypothetical protein GCM10011391_17410 [Pullulanibacillus camelliae]|uniref:DUF421 domain-containing protein n=1 Tax=Pullulanibacillus camelliae TaxID=1707096 RepID=A0A8J2YGH5_9BACL|nr:DUF421 domain-containing protein [Pullulanibacillus camelliae]GGE39125.1 hypothetical protein GCM10011391_17410 [Pullulanibacillus camelliae]